MEDDDHLRVSPAAAKRPDRSIEHAAGAAESRLADRAHTEARLLERRPMLLDRVRVERDVVHLAVGAAERPAPAALRPRRMKIGVDEMTARAEHTRHLPRPAG